MKQTLPWVQTYLPTSGREVQGNGEALTRLKSLISGNKAVFLYGPVGCGKTCSIFALAKDLGYEVIEVNASDVRNKEGINQIVGHSLQQRSLFHKGKIILVDEVDGIAGNKDRGGVQALVKLIEEAKQPLVLTANNPWSSKFSTLRKKTQLIEFKPLEVNTIVKILETICAKEHIVAEEAVLKALARRSGGGC